MTDEYISREKTLELLKSLSSRDYRRKKGTIQDAIKMISYAVYTPAPTLRRCDMGGGFTMMTVYSLVVNATTQNLTTAIIADYAGQRWMVFDGEN